jgi:hypothetical protein
VLADGELIASRGGNTLTRVMFGAGFPEPDQVLELLTARLR